MNKNINAPWLFVIDTEDYAGNFERELCAFITGQCGECGAGEDMAALFKEQVTTMGDSPFSNVIGEADEHGCHRPASIYPTPNWFNDGMGGSYQKGGEKAALEIYKKNSAKHHRNSCYTVYWKDWQENPVNRERYIKAGWTETSLKKAAELDEKRAIEAETSGKLSKYPAYQSVSISFSKKPAEHEVDIMRSRAKIFSEMRNENNESVTRISKIIGFRVIKNTVKRTTEEEKV